MRLTHFTLIILAIIVAGGCGFLVKYLLDNQSGRTNHSPGGTTAAVEVLVADLPLARGTTIGAKHIVWVRWPAENLNPNYVVRQSDLRETELFGLIVVRAIAAGEPVLMAKLIKPTPPRFDRVIPRHGC